MTTIGTQKRRSPDQESLKSLLDLCKAGRLFEVQEWIAAGNPVNVPEYPESRRRERTPLEVAIDLGFHSLVEVLLKGGAIQEPEGYDSPMNRAIRLKRFDIIKLLVEHGFDPKTVDMREVLCAWDPKVMEYFIERGADLKTDRPFAHAFCVRIRTALRLYKECREKDPELQEQADIALRYHCKAGNLKWVSLMLWVGANPFAEGPLDADSDEGFDYSAIGIAALYKHFDVLRLKKIRLAPDNPAVSAIVKHLCEEQGFDLLERLLEKGLNPNDQPNGGCSAIHRCLIEVSWGRIFDSWEVRSFGSKSMDSYRAREKLKAIYLLAKHGGKWVPEDNSEINDVRRSLVQMDPDYTVEFIWIMSKFKACSLDSIKALLRTPKMKSHLAKHGQRVQEIIAAWPTEAAAVESEAKCE